MDDRTRRAKMLTLHAKNITIVRWQDGPLKCFTTTYLRWWAEISTSYCMCTVCRDEVAPWWTVGQWQQLDQTRPVFPTMDWSIAALSICVIFCSMAYNINSAIPLHLSDLQCDHCPLMAARRSCSTLHGLKALDIARATWGSDRSVMSNGLVNTTDQRGCCHSQECYISLCSLVEVHDHNQHVHFHPRARP